MSDEIVIVGDPVLREIAKPVTGDEQELVDLLCRVMKDAHALGLAAPQIGVSRRVAVVQMPEDDSATVLINPRIVETHGEEIADEGCLSIPDVRLPIKRFARIRYESAGRCTVIEEGLRARAIQHEIDHLDGILITDRLAKQYKEQSAELARVRGLLQRAQDLLSEARENLIAVHICGSVPSGSNLAAMCGMNAQDITRFKEATAPNFRESLELVSQGAESADIGKLERATEIRSGDGESKQGG